MLGSQTMQVGLHVYRPHAALPAKLVRVDDSMTTHSGLSEDSHGPAGEVRPDCPVALIENKSDGETDTMKVIPCEHQLPQQREQVRRPKRFHHALFWLALLGRMRGE